MDSLTQLTLGAAVGEAVLGRKVGRKAALWGAACGTFPDLDVFLPFGDAVRDFTYHRSFSHSLFVLTLLTPFFVWLILKLHPKTALQKNHWALLVWLVFMTHILLDCFTVYGTQIFWPFWNYPVGWGSIFIIDPVYTGPLLIGVISALVLSRNSDRGQLLNRAGLVVSSIYLAWSIGAQTYVTAAVERSLSSMSVPYEKLLVSAGPLNTMLWRVVVMKPDGNYYEGFYSLLDGSPEVTLSLHESRKELLEGLEGQWPVQRLRWFSKGFYKVWLHDGEVIISDLRMGVEPDYVFAFAVAKAGNPRALLAAIQRVPANRDLDQLKKAWQRIWSASDS
ncbi:MAG: hydrolase [Desulfuromonas sp.]|nr:MAG: hydrolase [Desulfuromonas sp.]